MTGYLGDEERRGRRTAPDHHQRDLRADQHQEGRCHLNTTGTDCTLKPGIYIMATQNNIPPPLDIF